MKNIFLFSLIFFSSLLFISCSDLKDNIPAAPDINIHGNNVFDVSSSNFHGEKVIASKNKFADCQQCHAADFSGGITKVSCASSSCHPSIAVHQKGIIDTSSSNFHGVYIANNFSGQMSVCKNCHGDSYLGGVISPSCVNCHSTINIHKDGIVDPQSPNFHGKYISTLLGWDMRVCGSCHRANYSGGFAAPSCLSCHTGTNGPEACNTCHGDFNDPTKIAPPRALNGNTDPSYPGVGAHASHLYTNNLGSSISCSTCHKVPQSVYTDGHLSNDGKAEVIFGGISFQGGVNPGYSFTNNTCSDSYCHGNFKLSKSSSSYPFAYTDSIMSGNNKTVKWNSVGQDQAACGSCHGLPPIGHVPVSINACVNCHTGIVDVDGNIIDKSKHINGVVNVFGN